MPLLSGIFASSGGGSLVTGGFLYSDATHYYSVFLGGTTTFTVSSSPLNVDLVVVGAGGGAGTAAGGGGGAGGVVVRSGMLTTGSYTAVVGLGGNGATGDGVSGSNGGNSTFDTITAIGGGGGAHNGTGSSGGAGGGAGYSNGNLGGAATQGNSGGGTGYGFAGGNNSRAGSGPPYPCGGGGGAGGVGGTATGSSAGVGGVGITSSLINSIAAATGIGQLSGGNYYLAGGGGGSVDSTLVAGGLGGGGFGGTVVTASVNTATDGLDSYGAGGGAGDVDGGGYPPIRAGRGGDGLIVLRYAKGSVGDVPVSSYTRSGLLFDYDASNSASYSGSGTTWTDLVAGRNLSLVDTTYSSSNGGGIVLNGTSSYGTASLGSLTGSYTVEMAINRTLWNIENSTVLALTSSTDEHGLLVESSYPGSVDSGTAPVRYLHRVPYGASGGDNMFSTTEFPLNTNQVITVVRTAGQKQEIYVNGVKVSTTLYPAVSSFDSGLTTLTLGKLGPIVSMNLRFFSGTVYSLRGYTRALPAEEIKANFNAIKTRLGL